MSFDPKQSVEVIDQIESKWKGWSLGAKLAVGFLGLCLLVCAGAFTWTELQTAIHAGSGSMPPEPARAWQPSTPANHDVTDAGPSTASSPTPAQQAPQAFMEHLQAFSSPDASMVIGPGVAILESHLESPNDIIQNGNVTNYNSYLDSNGRIVQNGEVKNYGGILKTSDAADASAPKSKNRKR